MPKAKKQFKKRRTLNDKRAQLCPVCQGSGKVNNPNYNPNSTYPGEKIVDCYGCMGRGWVAV